MYMPLLIVVKLYVLKRMNEAFLTNFIADEPGCTRQYEQ